MLQQPHLTDMQSSTVQPDNIVPTQSLPASSAVHLSSRDTNTQPPDVAVPHMPVPKLGFVMPQEVFADGFKFMSSTTLTLSETVSNIGPEKMKKKRKKMKKKETRYPRNLEVYQ